MPPSPHPRRSSPRKELRMETSHRRGVVLRAGCHPRPKMMILSCSMKCRITREKTSCYIQLKILMNQSPLNMSRGRTTISISKPSTIDKTPKTNRSSANPHRLSSSPRSGYSVFQSRARPSSAPRSSPPPVRPTTPLRRPSTPPTKPSTPTPRSSTPTLRRMSTGSTGPLSSSLRGTSPVKSTRGNSASPKLRGWQANLPGFSTNALPNLRTSLSDRSSSRVRGLSPTSGMEGIYHQKPEGNQCHHMLHEEPTCCTTVEEMLSLLIVGHQ